MTQTITPTTTAPRIAEPPRRTMAVLECYGDPALVGNRTVRKLFKEVSAAGYTPTGLRSRWLNAHQAPKERWIARWAVPVPDDAEAPAHVPLEAWYGNRVVEVVHVGPYAEATETIQRLREFAHDAGYVIAGPHEEEYLTPPGVEPERTIFRFEVREA